MVDSDFRSSGPRKFFLLVDRGDMIHYPIDTLAFRKLEKVIKTGSWDDLRSVFPELKQEYPQRNGFSKTVVWDEYVHHGISCYCCSGIICCQRWICKTCEHSSEDSDTVHLCETCHGSFLTSGSHHIRGYKFRLLCFNDGGR